MFENFLTVAQQVVILFILIGLGAILTRAKVLTRECISGMTNLVLYVVTPCVIIESFEREFDQTMLVGLGITCLIAFAVHGIGILLAKLAVHHPDEAKEKVYRFAVIFSNCGYMSLPLMNVVLGSEGVFYGAAYIAVYNIMLWTYGLSLMSGKSEGMSVKKIVTNPGIIGVTIGLILFLSPLSLPEIIASPVGYMASLNTPIPMLVIGFNLVQASPAGVLKAGTTWLVCGLRLIAVPLISFALMYAVGVRGTILVACTISASAPTAAGTTMFAMKFGGDAELAGNLVSVTTLLSVVTMPILVAVAQMV